MTVSTVPLENVALSVSVEGNGPAVVLLHGFPHTRQLWDPIIPALAEHLTVIAPDLRGLGNSSRPDTGYTAADVAGDSTSLLERLGIEKADVVVAK